MAGIIGEGINVNKWQECGRKGRMWILSSSSGKWLVWILGKFVGKWLVWILGRFVGK
jgi:hypothetical protein